jgi:hypothetical protein
MAVVHPEERAASAGILSVSRNTGAASAPLFTAPILVNSVLGLPFLLAGGLKIVYDFWIFAVFRSCDRLKKKAASKTPQVPPRGLDAIYLKALVRL